MHFVVHGVIYEKTQEDFCFPLEFSQQRLSYTASLSYIKIYISKDILRVWLSAQSVLYLRFLQETMIIAVVIM